MGFLLLVLFSVLYWITLAPTVLWGDSAKLSVYVKEMYFASDPVGNHMLHTLFGKLFSFLPVGDFAYRQNLMSACFGIATLVVFYSVMGELLRDRMAAFLALLCLGISHTFWLVSVINESYSLFTFLFVSGLFLWFRWEKTGRSRYLYLHFFLMGLSFLNNLLGGFTFLMTFLLLVSSPQGRRWSASWKGIFGFLLFLVALSPIAVLSVTQTAVKPGVYAWFLRPKGLLHELIFYPAYLFYQFPLFGFIAGFIGLKVLFRERRQLFWSLSILFVLDIMFASTYMRQRRFFLFLPSYLAFTVWIGFGIREMSSRLRHSPVLLRGSVVCGTILLPILIYLGLPPLAERFHLDLVRGRQLAFRDNNRFYLNPVKRDEFGPRDYGLKALEVAKPNSLIIGDFTPAMVLLYYQVVEGQRPDVSIETKIDQYVRSPQKREELYATISKELKKRPVYIADNEESYYRVRELKRRFDVVPWGPLWEIRRRDI